MLDFIIGGIYTLAIIALSFRVGLYVGARVEPELFNDLKRAFKPKRKLQSGPIKPYTKAERDAEANATMNGVIEGLREP